MTNKSSFRIGLSAGAAILAGLLATSVGAQGLRQISLSAPPPRAVVLFFDLNSDRLTPEANAIVRSAVNSAERAQADQIEVATYAAADESASNPGLAARRAATLKEQIAKYGFEGSVVIDEEASDVRLAGPGEETFDRRAILRVGG